MKMEVDAEIMGGSRIATNWRARRDLNPQPSDPKSDALSS